MKARAYKVGLNPSAVASGSYLIQQVPVNGLIAYWPLDEGSGSVADDMSSQDHQGTVTGATWTTGLSGGALSFDGVNDEVQTESNLSVFTLTS